MATNMQFPWNLIVRITDTIGGVGFQGSGVLISPTEVLTASHVVARSDLGAAATSSIQVAPGYDLGSEPYGVYLAKTFDYYTITDPYSGGAGLILPDASAYDFALITLSRPVTVPGPYFTPGYYNPFSGTVSVTVAGYPGSLDGQPEEETQNVSYGPSASVFNGLGLGEGSSGGPVWVSSSSGAATVVGVVSGGNSTTGSGIFAALNPTSYSQILTWEAANALPSVTLRNVTLGPNESDTLVSMISSLNDPNGDSVSGYQVTDDGGGGGYLMFNGAVIAKNAPVFVSASNLGALSFIAGSVPGSETLAVTPYDATEGVYATGSALTVSTAATPVHQNNLAYSGSVSGPDNFIDFANLEASYPDLIAAFGANQAAMQSWYYQRQVVENRLETFDGLDYIASYGDLVNAFASAGSERAVQDAGAKHYIAYGEGEGRTTTFNGLDYIASYGDLISAFAANADAGAYHYIEYGSKEGRSTTFDGLDYIASYSDLISAYGDNEQAGAAHFIDYGYRENRTTSFDGLAYIANYPDLMRAFGANNDAGATHYIDYGQNEGRLTAFNVAGYERAHPDLIGKYSTPDAFLSAYITRYGQTGTYLT